MSHHCNIRLLQYGQLASLMVLCILAYALSSLILLLGNLYGCPSILYME